jgi:putative two-component system response regulator
MNNQHMPTNSREYSEYDPQFLLYVKDFNALLKERDQTYKDLYNAHLNTLTRLARAAEFKDDDTGIHLTRMSKFSEMLARAFGMPNEFCELIYIASPMHDIGKMGVPDSILKKKGKLDASEWEIMRKHPEFGADILGDSDVPVVKLAAEIALSHHEKYNGTGYPYGLKGKEIPLSARIVSIADFYDALTMERCYKPAYSDTEAFNLIKSEKSKHFDPELAECFISIQKDIILMKNEINQTN